MDTGERNEITTKLQQSGHRHRAADVVFKATRTTLIADIHAALRAGMFPAEIGRACGWSRAQINIIRAGMPDVADIPADTSDDASTDAVTASPDDV